MLRLVHALARCLHAFCVRFCVFLRQTVLHEGRVGGVRLVSVLQDQLRLKFRKIFRFRPELIRIDLNRIVVRERCRRNDRMVRPGLGQGVADGRNGVWREDTVKIFRPLLMDPQIRYVPMVT